MSRSVVSLFRYGSRSRGREAAERSRARYVGQCAGLRPRGAAARHPRKLEEGPASVPPTHSPSVTGSGKRVFSQAVKVPLSLQSAQSPRGH